MADEWDQFEAVATAAPATTTPGDWSQFETHKGPATHQDLVFQSLKDYGATPTTTAAIMGDIKQESSYRPRLPGDGGTSWGLLQVGTPMFRQFEADQASKGIAAGSQDYVYNQAPFILDRFKRQHPDRWEAMQNAPSSGEALKIFRGTPDWGYGIAGSRYKYAQSYEEKLKGVPVEEVIKPVQVEKAIPVNVREVQVSRARPVEGAPEPVAAEATPTPAEDWSQFAEVTPPTEQAAAPTDVGFGPGVATPYPEGSPEALAMSRARPLLATQVPAETARAPSLEESVTGAIPDFGQFAQVEPPRRIQGPPTTVPEAYQEAGGGIGGVINALDFASKQPVLTEDHAKQLVSLAAGGARTAARLTGHKDVEQGLEEELSKTVSGFTTPEGLAQIAVLKNPVARALFAGETLAKIPEDINAIARAYKSGDKKELGRAIAAASVNATMGASMAAEPLGIRPRGRAGAPEEIPGAPVAAAPPVEAPAAAPPEAAPVEAPAAAPEAAPPEAAPVEAPPAAPPEAAPPVEAPVPTEAPAAPVEPRGGAWQGIPFLSQDRIKAGLGEMGYSSEQIEGMTRSELRAIDWQAKTRGPGAPEPAGPPTMEPKETAPGPGEAAPTAPIEDWSQFEEVLAPTAPAAAPAAAEPSLPADLRGAKPRYNYGSKSFGLEFESDLDKASYIAAQATKSKADARYVEFVASATGLSEPEIRARGQQIRERIKAQAKSSSEPTLTVPSEAERARREHEAEMVRTGQEAIAEQGGMDLLQAVQLEGHLPASGHRWAEPYRGELKMLRETVRGTKGVRYRDVFSSNPKGNPDELLNRLRARGFNIETPHQLIAAIEQRIRSGIPHYGLPEAGAALYRPEEGPVRRAYPAYTTEQLREMAKTAPPETRAKMEAEIAARESGRAPVYKTPQIIPKAPEFKLAEPETLKEQKAREAREKAEAKAREIEAEKAAKIKYGWKQKLTGTAGDLGQQELGGVIPGPEAPELFAGAPRPPEAPAEAPAAAPPTGPEQGQLFRPGAQPETLPRQITPTPTGIAARAPGAPIAEADIRNYLSRALDIPVRAGMRVAGGMQRALGVYRVRQESIRTRLRNDIPTIAHEVGHYVHHLLFTDPSGKPSQFATAYDNELMPLGRRTSLPSYSVKQVRMEGVAEFAREWLTDRSQALAKAPNFTGFFEGELQGKYPQTWEIFQKARSDIAKFIGQPGWEKAQSKIVFDPREPRGTYREWLSRKYTEWFNELAPLDRTMKRLTAFGLDPATAQRVSERAINYKGGWRGKADFDLEFDQTNIDGNKVGKGLKAVLNGLDTKELGDFSTYVALKRAAEKSAQGVRTGFEQDLQDPEVRKRMADLAPRYEQKRQALIKYSDNALQLLADSGFFTDQQMAKMRQANKDYVPFYRIYEDVRPAGPRGTTKSGGFVNTSSGVLRMKGSDRQIIDPLESIVKNTYAFRDLAERNRIGREFVNAVEKTQGGGRIGESVMKPIKPSHVSHEEITAHLEKLGLDESDIKSLGPDIGMTLWRATNGIKPSDGVFRVWQNGKERLFQVDDPDLLKALSLADSTDAAAIKMLPLFKPFRAVTRMLRTGATLTPEFMARNPFRDQVTAAVFSRYNFLPFFDGFRGMLSVLGKDQYYKDWIKAGGRYSGLYDIEGPTMRKTLERVVRDPGALEQAWLMLRHPLQTLGAVSGVFENATRVGEFRKAIDAGVDPMTAANASKDVTLNFSRAGIKGKLANQVLAFFNAGLQDVDKFARAHRDAPVRTATKAFMYITVPSILTWALGKDDPQIQNLPEWRKDFFWNLNVKGTVLSLPKPFLLGALYGTSVEKALDYANGRDPNAVWKALNAIYQVGSPARGDMIAATNAFKPLVENITNYSFFQGRPLVSESQRQLSPAMQFGPNTSETAKFVGKKLDQSPIKIDNLIRGYFGGLGRYGTDMTDWVLLKAQGADTPAPPAKTIAQYPLIKGFVKQPYEASAYVQRFYNGLDKAETRLNDLRAYGQQLDSPGMRKFLKDNRDQVAWYNAGAGQGTLMTELRKTRDDLSDINKAMVAVQQSRAIDPEEKAKRLIRLGEMRDKLAEAAFKTYIHPSDREKVF